MSESRERDGVLPVDKPSGPTSHDVVDRARRALGVRRIGHTGTLDPFASGLLLLCVGRATRLAEYLAGLDKTYVATARLGVTTDTLDREGRIEAQSEAWRGVDVDDLERALSPFRGRILQVPPSFSAKKRGGERLYEKARRGEPIRIEPVPVEVYELELLRVALPRVAFRVRCSSGTYVRALARDVGQALGVGAHLEELRRTGIGAFRVEDAVPAAALNDAIAIGRAWLTPARAMASLPAVRVTAEDARRLGMGQSVSLADSLAPEGEPVAVLLDDRLVAIGTARGGTLRPRKVLAHD